MLKLYNTLSRKKENFIPLKKGLFKSKEIGLYTCGPTVYNFAHIGNLRSYIFEDILKRVLEYNNYKVKHVMNITDVGHLTSDADEGEDKMEKGAKREGKTAWEIAEFYTQAFKSNLHDLNIEEPNIWCKATDHIPEQIKLVQKLIDKGFTYETSDGIYFDTTKIDDYGKLANLKNQKLKAGERVEIGEKKNPHDFTLWKFSGNEKRQMEWQAFGHMGFPGWHIECSAMSMKYLGEQFDIHCGGIDHIPVHHTNEIAQSESVTGKKPWVKYWMHNEFLLLNLVTIYAEGKNKFKCPHCKFENDISKSPTNYHGAIDPSTENPELQIICKNCNRSFSGITKMSKSGPAFITLETLKTHGISPLAYRYFLLQTHYRKQLTFSWEALEAAQTSLERMYKIVPSLRRRGVPRFASGDGVVSQLKQNFLEKINDDLNTPQAIAIIWDAITKKQINYSTLLDFDKVLGLGLADIKEEEKTEISIEVQKLLDARAEARKQKNWAKSDDLREEIKKLGFNVEDSADGQKIQPF